HRRRFSGARRLALARGGGVLQTEAERAPRGRVAGPAGEGEEVAEERVPGPALAQRRRPGLGPLGEAEDVEGRAELAGGAEAHPVAAALDPEAPLAAVEALALVVLEELGDLARDLGRQLATEV